MPSVRSVVAFGDTVGLPRLLNVLEHALVRAIVRAEVRPEQAAELQELAAAAGVPLLVQPRPGTEASVAFVKQIRRLAPDLILVDSYSMLIEADVLSSAPHGGVNIHAALLPEYRGANPLQWALINDERRTGVTMHHMTTEFDAGDVIARRELPIRVEDTWVDVLERIQPLTAQLLAEALPGVLMGNAPRLPQDERRARHWRRRHRNDGRFDWSARTLDIYNLVRALVRPHPGAFFLRNGEEVVLDEPLTISAIAALKHAEGALRMPVRPLRGESTDVMELETYDGHASLVIDWDRRSAMVEAPSADSSKAVRQFASDELGLTTPG